MAIALGVTASHGPLSIALRLPDGTIEVVAAEVGSPGNRASGDLVAIVARAFDERDLAPTDLEELRLDLGPGSYTGLRVAVTFARMLQAFHRIPVLTTTSLQLMAMAAWSSGAVETTRAIRPVIDARRQRYHHARVAFADGIRLDDPPRATTAADLLATIGDELVMADAALQGLFPEGTECTEPPGFDAGSLFDPQLTLALATSESLSPLYLMGSYAD